MSALEVGMDMDMDNSKLLAKRGGISDSTVLSCCAAPDTRIQIKIGGRLADKPGVTLNRKFCFNCGCTGEWYDLSENSDYWWAKSVKRHLQQLNSLLPETPA